MNRKRGLLIILLLVSSALPLLLTVPMAEASELTVSIERSEDDVWMTEAGNVFGYESSVRILHESIGLQAFIRFEDVGLSKSDKINVATLNVYAGFDQGERLDPGASVTIYGIDEPDCSPFSYSGRVWSLSRPYTSASVNWNLSDWGYGWHQVNVTDIVREIVNQYAWVENNSLGFQIIGASDSGHEVRTFEDIDHQHHGAYAYLNIQYGLIGEEEPPDDEFEFVEQYDEYTVWLLEGEFEEGEPSTVDTSTVVTSVANGYQRNGFYDAGLFWSFYSDGTNAGWEFSNDGTTWDGAFTSIGACTSGVWFSVWFDETAGFVHYVRYNTADSDLFYRRGTPESDGDITWCEAVQLVESEDFYLYPCILVDSNGYAWIGGSTGALGGDLPHVVKNANNDGTWTTDFTYDLSVVTDSTWRVGIAPMTDGKVYAVYSRDNQALLGKLYDAGWGEEENDLTDYAHEKTAHFSVVVNDDDVNLVYNRITTNQIRHNKRVWGVGWNDADVLVQDSVESNTAPVLSVDPSNGDVYCFWTSTSTDHVYYKKYNGGWDVDPTDWIDESTDDIQYPNQLSSFYANYGGYIGLLYVTRTASPYNIKFAFLSMAVDDIYIITDENDTIIPSWNGENCTSLECIEDWIDDNLLNGGDPLDPDPGTQGWDTEGPFTRFKMRLYFMFIGLGCLFAPLWAMAYKKFDAVGYTWCFLIMVLGVGLLWSITGI